MHLRGTGTFRPVSPVVFVSLVEGISQCEQLADAVRRGPLAIDLALPVPPARHHRPPPRRRRSSTGPSTSSRTSSASSTSRTSTSTCTTTTLGWQPTRDFAAAAGVPEPHGLAEAARHRPRSHELRARHPRVDHVVRTQEHYGEVKAGQQAGAVDLLRLPVVLPDPGAGVLRRRLRRRRSSPTRRTPWSTRSTRCFPGIIGTGEGQISLDDIEDAAGAVGLIGLVGVLYAGLGWLSALRDALIVGLRAARARAAQLRDGQAPRPDHAGR